jgi:hypothetical protein
MKNLSWNYWRKNSILWENCVSTEWELFGFDLSVLEGVSSHQNISYLRHAQWKWTISGHNTRTNYSSSDRVVVSVVVFFSRKTYSPTRPLLILTNRNKSWTHLIICDYLIGVQWLIPLPALRAGVQWLIRLPALVLLLCLLCEDCTLYSLYKKYNNSEF